MPSDRGGVVAHDCIPDEVPALAERRFGPTGTAEIEYLRELARRGVLGRTAATPGHRRGLSAATYALSWPIVFDRLTRPLERRRGHAVCAIGLPKLSGECLDRFYDDVEAVVDYVLRHANKPIANLDAWIATRLTAATVDGHRRQRGSRGAMQRPRLPGWLSAALGDDRWRCELALEILVWVGVTATAGCGLWPLDAWAERRAAATGDWAGGTAALQADLERVLAVMRGRPDWYATYVETPLGRKQAPVAVMSVAPGDRAAYPDPLRLAQQDEVDEARLNSLAVAAMTAIEARLRRGEDRRAAVSAVIERVFGTGTGPRDLDRAPHAGSRYDEWAGVLLADSVRRERIVGAILDIFDEPGQCVEPA